MKFDYEKLKPSIYHAARGVAFVAAVFSLILCVLLIANYFQTTAVDPLNSPALTKLMKEQKEDPANEVLKDQIRALDLLSRKAYFTGQWQLRTGGYLLLGGIILLLLALKLMSTLRKTLPFPEGAPDPDAWWFASAKARKWIAYAGVFVLLTTLTAAFLAHSELNRDDLFENIAKGASAEDFLNNWASFRGPGANGIATTTKAPTHWDGKSGENIKWKVEVPMPGFSSPVVWEDRIFLTGADDKKRELFCFDAGSGELNWRREIKDVPGSMGGNPQIHDDTGYAAASAATDGQYVFAVYPTGELVAYDMEGRLIWAQSLGMPENHYGHSSSLLIHENILIVQYDQNEDARLLGLNTANGAIAWRVQRNIISWSSPICVNTGNRMELILTDSEALTSFDPKTGVKLWGEKCLGGEMGPSAAYAAGMVFAANEFASAVGVKVPQKEGEAPNIVWEWDENLPDTASPVATEKYLFLATSKGYMVCMDAQNGEMLWEQEFDDGFYASPVLVGDLVYAIDLQGVTHIFKADKVYHSVAEPKLGEPSSCTPAILEGRMFMRGDQYLYSIGK